MRRVLRLVIQTAGGLWSLAMILLMVTSLALSVAMTLIPQVLAMVSGAVETVTGRRTILAETRARDARLGDELDLTRQRAARASADLNAERAARRAETRALRQQIAGISDEAASAPVTYRGRKVAIREAVHDTSTRLSKRTATAATRNVGSTFGEALPLIGVGVIVAATAWELHDACQMMREMRELDAAFNPDNPIGEDEVCGITPPTRDEIWQKVKSSPAEVWEGARGLYADLPDVSISGTYDWTLEKLSGMSGWWAGDEADPQPAAANDAPSWSALGWLSGD